MNNYQKYPRTPHFPWSRSRTDDDKVLKNCDHFIGMNVIATIKMDGENSNLYRDYYHARSIDSNNHPSRNYVKAFHSTFKQDIPDGWRICAENLYATHSIHYSNLKSYLYGFSIWNEENYCLSWKDTLEYFELFGITPVQELYRGVWNEDLIKTLNYGEQEGYVVRNIESFHYSDFKKNVAKNVRPHHVQTNKHWMSQEIIPNELES